MFFNNEIKNMTQKLGTTKDGFAVHDQVESHVRGHPEILPFLEEGLANVKTNGEQLIVYEHDYKRVIGKMKRVSTNKDDKIVYAYRNNRDGPSRFVINKTAPDSTKATFILKKTENHYQLLTAWVGEKAPFEPWDWEGGHKKEVDKYKSYEKSVAFWEKNALVYSSFESTPVSEDFNENEYWIG